MIELFVLSRLGHKIARLARSGGLPPKRWVALLIVAWFLAEILGFMAGAAVGGLVGGDGLSLILAYVAALLAALGAQGTVFKALRVRIAATNRAEPAEVVEPFPFTD